MCEHLEAEEVFEILKGACVEINRKYLEEFRLLDTLIGDGDIGITVRKGCSAIADTLQNFQGKDIGEALIQCGKEFYQANPSTFAMLASCGFQCAGRNVKGKTRLSASDLVALFFGALEGIQKKGKVVIGEKTMVDSLSPAVECFYKAVNRGADLCDALQESVHAAEEGLEKTKVMIAKKGKAQDYGIRAVGVQDPGAAVVTYFLRELSCQMERKFSRSVSKSEKRR